MSRKRVVVPGGAGLTYSTAVAAEGEILFVSGLNAVDAQGILEAPGDVVGQTRAIYRKLAEVLAAAGGTLADVVRTTDYVLSRDNYRATAQVRRELLGPDFPAATGVVVKELLGRGVLIEIDAVAVPTREDAWAYTPEHRRLLAKAHKDSREGRVLELTYDELERVARTGRLPVRRQRATRGRTK